MGTVVEVYPVDMLRALRVYTCNRRDSGVRVADSVSYLEVPYSLKSCGGVKSLVVAEKLARTCTRGYRYTAERVPGIVD